MKGNEQRPIRANPLPRQVVKKSSLASKWPWSLSLMKKLQFIHSNRVLGKFPALVDSDDVAQSAGWQGEGWAREGRGLGSQYVAPQSVRLPSNRLVTSGYVGDMPSARCEAPSLGKRSRDFSAQPGSLR